MTSKVRKTRQYAFALPQRRREARGTAAELHVRVLERQGIAMSFVPNPETTALIRPRDDATPYSRQVVDLLRGGQPEAVLGDYVHRNRRESTRTVEALGPPATLPPRLEASTDDEQRDRRPRRGTKIYIALRGACAVSLFAAGFPALSSR